MLSHLISWFTHPTFNRVMLMLLTLAGLAGSVLWAPAMLATFMMFGDPNPKRSWMPWLVLLGVFSWPLCFLGCVVAAFVLLAHGAVALAYLSICLPLVPILMLLGLMLRPKQVVSPPSGPQTSEPQ